MTSGGLGIIPVYTDPLQTVLESFAELSGDFALPRMNVVGVGEIAASRGQLVGLAGWVVLDCT